MRVIQVNTYDVQGGAARACYRLHQGLRLKGVDSQLLVRYRTANDDSVFDAESAGATVPEPRLLNQHWLMQRYYIDPDRSPVSDSYFSINGPGYDLSTSPLVQAADIINLHWVTEFLAADGIAKLACLGKPIVWTLHDQRPFTGGCHFSAGCRGYERTCRACPQLQNDPWGLPAAQLALTLEALADADVTVVAPSRWIAETARASQAFCQRRVEVISNSVDTDVFSPDSGVEARTAFGIHQDATVIVFAVEAVRERRKGYREVASALQRCLLRPDLTRFAAPGQLVLLCFGWDTDGALDGLDLEIVRLGHVTDDLLIRRAYAAGDFVVVPSMEDNLPNALLEALACGVPVVGFDTGGIRDVIGGGDVGLLAPRGDVAALAGAIGTLMLDRVQREAMAKRARALALERFSRELQAEKYAALYCDLLSHKHDVARAGIALADTRPVVNQCKYVLSDAFTTAVLRRRAAAEIEQADLVAALAKGDEAAGGEGLDAHAATEAAQAKARIEALNDDMTVYRSYLEQSPKGLSTASIPDAEDPEPGTIHWVRSRIGSRSLATTVDFVWKFKLLFSHPPGQVKARVLGFLGRRLRRLWRGDTSDMHTALNAFIEARAIARDLSEDTITWLWTHANTLGEVWCDSGDRVTCQAGHVLRLALGTVYFAPFTADTTGDLIFATRVRQGAEGSVVIGAWERPERIAVLRSTLPSTWRIVFVSGAEARELVAGPAVKLLPGLAATVSSH